MAKVLVLYAANSVFTGTVRDYLTSFSEHSENEVYYLDSVLGAQLPSEFKYFDVVIVHYSVRLSLPDYISPWIADALKRFNGVKMLTIQDEYENTEYARMWIESLQFDVVLTCIPSSYIEAIYPQRRFPKTRFINVLTGYAPSSTDSTNMRGKSLRDRSILLGYRGRPLHPFYGRLGLEKSEIGRRMKSFAVAHGLKVDIEWSESARIYGDSWLSFLSNCRATLGTESGANIFDFDGSIKKNIDSYLATRPGASFEEIERKFLIGLEGKYATMNQISPKMFEAIALKTVLVLYEGEYSGILVPDRHFIVLKKDHSNIAEVFKKLDDFELLEKISECAYKEIIESGKYSYKSFVQKVDSLISEIISARGITLSTWRARQALIGFHDEEMLQFDQVKLLNYHSLPLTSFEYSYLEKRNMFGLYIFGGSLKNKIKYFIIRFWRRLPTSVRQCCGPFLKKWLFMLKGFKFSN